VEGRPLSLLLSRWAKLYSNQTEAERALEPAVASLGLPYRTQHPLWSLALFPDFCLPGIRVLIEVDDPSHKRRKREDAERTARLEGAGWKVVRCQNAEALSDPYATVTRLMAEAGYPYLVATIPNPINQGTS
jgi:very-short-patch-repair endonuclease